MGLFDKVSNILGGKKTSITETAKGARDVLGEHGIDASNLKFFYEQDGSVTVSGQVDSQPECDRICETLEGMPNLKTVQNKISIGAPEPVVVPEPEPVVVTEEAVSTGAEAQGRTYTVQSGDSLWKISEKMYGSGTKYMKIFEANTSLLENPDKIFPGQELVIPDLDE